MKLKAMLPKEVCEKCGKSDLVSDTCNNWDFHIPFMSKPEIEHENFLELQAEADDREADLADGWEPAY